MTYEPTLRYKRTAAERADELLAWERPDKAFFAAGACHILAWVFLESYPTAGFSAFGLRRVGRPHAGHVYVSDGTWAFDHDGWTREEELLAVTGAAHRAIDAGCEFERLSITGDLETLCKEHNARTPSQFAFDPRPRAQRYLARFDPPDAGHRPPESRWDRGFWMGLSGSSPVESPPERPVPTRSEGRPPASDSRIVRDPSSFPPCLLLSHE